MSPLLARHSLQLISGWYSGFLGYRSPEAEWEAPSISSGCWRHAAATCWCTPNAAGSRKLLRGINRRAKARVSARSTWAYAERVREFAARLNERGMKLATIIT